MGEFVDPTTHLRIKNPIIEKALLERSLGARDVRTLAAVNAVPPKPGGGEVDTCGVLVSKV